MKEGIVWLNYACRQSDRRPHNGYHGDTNAFPTRGGIVDVLSFLRSSSSYLSYTADNPCICHGCFWCASSQRGCNRVETPAMPVFALVARSHHTLSTELAKCQNNPSVDNGVAILEAIRDLKRKFDMVTVRMRAMKQVSGRGWCLGVCRGGGGVVTGRAVLGCICVFGDDNDAMYLCYFLFGKVR